MKETIAKLRELVDSSDNIVFFGGAGVSTESGIPDFRSTDGLYHQKFREPPETIISHSYYVKHPDVFFKFYRTRMLYPDARPNIAHKKLAQWEHEGRLLAVVTQNIDGLHQMAGSKNVYELHGSVHRNICQTCGKVYDLQAFMQMEHIPVCPACGGRVKPDVVLYEESLDEDVMAEAIHYIRQADMLIIGGTSLVVYPAAGLVQYYRGHKLAVINKGGAGSGLGAAVTVDAPIGQVMAQL